MVSLKDLMVHGIKQIKKIQLLPAHLEDTYKTHTTNTNDDDIQNVLDVAQQMYVPLKHIFSLETKKEINLLHNNKSIHCL